MWVLIWATSVLKLLWERGYRRWGNPGGPRRCPWGISWWERSSLVPSRWWRHLPPLGESRLTSPWCHDEGIWRWGTSVCVCGKNLPQHMYVLESCAQPDITYGKSVSGNIDISPYLKPYDHVRSCELISAHVTPLIMWSQWSCDPSDHVSSVIMWPQWSCELSDHVIPVIMWPQWSCDLSDHVSSAIMWAQWSSCELSGHHVTLVVIRELSRACMHVLEWYPSVLRVDNISSLHSH